MASEVERPRRGDRLLLAADAFLFAGALYVVVTSIVPGIPVLAGADLEAMAESLGPAWGSALSLAVSGIAVVMGAMAAWRMHGREAGRGEAAVLVGGAAAGIVIAMAVFVGMASAIVELAERLGVRGPGEGPWVVLGVLALVVIAFVGMAIRDAVRDMAAERREHVRLDWLRLAAAALIVLLGVVFLPWVGFMSQSEVGEAGAFMVPFAAGAAIAVTGADIAHAMRARRRGTAGVFG